MEIKIRKAKKKDIVNLSTIYTLVYKEFAIGENWTIETSKKLIEYWFKRQSDLFFIAEKNKEIIGGFVAGVKPWWNGMHLVDGELFVHPKYQKLKIGTNLLKTVLKKAIKKYKVIYFDSYTFKKTKFPLNWYKKIGFKKNTEWTMIERNVKSILSKLNKK